MPVNKFETFVVGEDKVPVPVPPWIDQALVSAGTVPPLVPPVKVTVLFKQIEEDEGVTLETIAGLHSTVPATVTVFRCISPPEPLNP